MSSYTIRPGDTMWAIAQRHGVSLSALKAANPQIRNPNLIYAGRSLNIPDGFNAPKASPVNLSGNSSGGSYTVRPGDTLSAIGARYGVSYQSIAQANGIANPNLIFPGQVLRIPGSNGAGPTPRGGPGNSPSPAPTPGPVGKPGGWSPNNSGKLYGYDTSGWQGDGTFQSTVNGSQFSMIKASEGTGFVDHTFAARWNELGQKVASGQMALRVAYQFMTPGNGTAQADHFLNTVGVHGPLPAGTRLCLDWEASALNDPQALHDAANRIHDVTGVWPLIYTSGSQVARARAAAPNAPIWEAKWGGSVPSDVPFVQYSDGGGSLDHDVFNGDLAALRHFAGWN